MEWDLGARGLLVLLGMSLVVGLVSQLVLWRVVSHRFWILATAVNFLSGLFTSEVLFGWATGEHLQPNINGLSFDEVLMSSIVTFLVILLLVRIAGHRANIRAPRARA